MLFYHQRHSTPPLSIWIIIMYLSRKKMCKCRRGESLRERGERGKSVRSQGRKKKRYSSIKGIFNHASNIIITFSSQTWVKIMLISQIDLLPDCWNPFIVITWLAFTGQSQLSFVERGKQLNISYYFTESPGWQGQARRWKYTPSVI